MQTVQSNRMAATQTETSPEDRDAKALPGGEAGALLAGADVGLALFDKDLRLLACNELYRTLRGYSTEETVSGAHIADLIRAVLVRQEMPPDEIDARISVILERLTPGGIDSTRYVTPSAKPLEVHRRCLPSGTVVETVRELGASAVVADLNIQFAQMAANARQRMMHALDVMNDGFAMYDRDGRLIVFNRKYVESRCAISELVVVGASYETLLREEINRGSVNTGGVEVDDYTRQRLEWHRDPLIAVELNFTDGRWVRISETRTSDGGTVQTRTDITQMKRRECDLVRLTNELHTRNVIFDATINNMIQGVAMYDSNQHLTMCNRRYLEMYRMSADVVKPGIHLTDVMRHSAAVGNYTEEEARRVLSERPDVSKLKTRMTFTQRLRDGRVIAVMSEPTADGGSIATCLDVTESERLSEQMKSYTEKLERSNRELQDFAYVASHDLQEPLRKIEAFGDRLATRYGKELPDDGRMFLDRMQNAAGRMRRLINDLLNYSRVTTKAKPFVPVALHDVLAGVLSDLQIRIEETGAVINADPLPTIDGDAMQMRQLLQNILANALKFHKPDVKPEIRISCVTECDTLHGDVARLMIKDNGIGFDNKFKDQIFTIFQRLHGRLEYEGTGVGLATVRKIVERHDGTIDANGEPGVGATFTVVLPLKHVADRAAAAK
jgi:signal transduction histidine kinase